jgi:hypothetical protein
VLGALHNHLNSISFLCHCLKNLEWGRECTAFFPLSKQKCNVFLTSPLVPTKRHLKTELFFNGLEKKAARYSLHSQRFRPNIKMLKIPRTIQNNGLCNK